MFTVFRYSCVYELDSEYVFFFYFWFGICCCCRFFFSCFVIHTPLYLLVSVDNVLSQLETATTNKIMAQPWHKSCHFPFESCVYARYSLNLRVIVLANVHRNLFALQSFSIVFLLCFLLSILYKLHWTINISIFAWKVHQFTIMSTYDMLAFEFFI